MKRCDLRGLKFSFDMPCSIACEKQIGNHNVSESTVPANRWYSRSCLVPKRHKGRKIEFDVEQLTPGNPVILRDGEYVTSYKELEDPAHGQGLGRFALLIGDGLVVFRQGLP